MEGVESVSRVRQHDASGCDDTARLMSASYWEGGSAKYQGGW